MPDWKQLVRERLSQLNLPPGPKEDVVAELAAHLEDTAVSDHETGESENRALAQIHWHKLGRAIERTKSKEDPMNHPTKTILLPAIAILFAVGLVLVFLDRAAMVQRLIWIACAAMLVLAAATEVNHLNQRTRSLWLPALTTFFGASLSLMVCQLFGMQPRLVWIGKIAMSFYWPWLATLPIFGAVGAGLSQRAHGHAKARLAASLSPALIMLIVMALILPWGLAIDGLDFFRLVAFGLCLINWVAIPALALLLGALPFLRDSNLREVQLQ